MGTLFVALLAMASCGGEGAPDTAPDAPPADVPTRHLGLFVAGDYVEFEACSGEAYAIDGPVMTDLIAMHEVLIPGLEPLEAVFVDLLGTISGSGADGALDALEMRRVAYEGGGCAGNDAGIFFRGLGTEPFWSVAIGEDGFSWVTPETTSNFTHNGLQDGLQGEWIFEGLNADNAVAITATIFQEPCVDQMSGSWYHLTMRVDRADQVFQGCAYLGPEMEGD